MAEVTAQTKKFQKELNSGTSSLVLLSVLSRSKEAMYGYQIAKLLEESDPDFPMMKQGALYPVLRSLEEMGCWRVRWSPLFQVRRAGIIKLQAMAAVLWKSGLKPGSKPRNL